MDTIQIIHTFVYWLGTILSGAIIVRALLSWFSVGGTGGPVFRLLDDITEPVLGPLRRVIPPLGMIDITPLVGIILIQFLTSLVLGYIH